MSARDRELLDLLRFELEFLEQGGYGRSVRTPWKPKQTFMDSPSCLNFNDPQRPHPCGDCLLIDYVPPDLRGENIPCHHIPLNERGDTPEKLYDWQSEARLEDAMRQWLKQEIARLEARLADEQKAAG